MSEEKSREQYVADGASFEETLWGGTSEFGLGMWVWECAVNVFRAMMEEAGLNHTLEASKHYNEAWGRALFDVVKERIGPQANDLETIAMTGFYGHCCTSMGHIKPLEIREGGAICELYACPNPGAKAPPEMCIAMSHVWANTLCKIVNPEYGAIFTHHLVNNDDCCRWVVMKKAGMFTIDNLGRLEKAVPMEVSMEEMVSFSMRMVVFNQLFTFTTVFNDLVGPQRAMELVAPLARETGLRLGTKLKCGTGEKGDPSMIKNKMDAIGAMLQQSGTPATITDSCVERIVTECPCKGAPPEVCKQFESVFNGVCEAINPDYEFSYDRMMSEGEPICHWVIRRKDMASPVNETALEILKKRFARGEVSKEEYLEMKALMER